MSALRIYLNADQWKLLPSNAPVVIGANGGDRYLDITEYIIHKPVISMGIETSTNYFNLNGAKVVIKGNLVAKLIV